MSIEKLLDEVEWEAVPIEKGESELPYVTHQGIMRLGNLELKVLVLNDGRRIIEEEDMNKFMEYLTHGKL